MVASVEGAIFWWGWWVGLGLVGVELVQSYQVLLIDFGPR
jgi:hypothetical protein